MAIFKKKKKPVEPTPEQKQEMEKLQEEVKIMINMTEELGEVLTKDNPTWEELAKANSHIMTLNASGVIKPEEGISLIGTVLTKVIGKHLKKKTQEKELDKEGNK